MEVRGVFVVFGLGDYWGISATRNLLNQYPTVGLRSYTPHIGCYNTPLLGSNKRYV